MHMKTQIWHVLVSPAVFLKVLRLAIDGPSVFSRRQRRCLAARLWASLNINKTSPCTFRYAALRVRRSACVWSVQGTKRVNIVAQSVITIEKRICTCPFGSGFVVFSTHVTVGPSAQEQLHYFMVLPFRRFDQTCIPLNETSRAQGNRVMAVG